jgi:uncharacterized protein (TIGR02996 family)
MSEADAFIQAILANPDDNTTRLAFADWLEKRGDPRGEFIRLQCALAERTTDQQLTALQAREWELLTEHEMAWVGPIRDWVVPETYRQMGEEFTRGDRWQFRRGFIESVFMDPSVFLTVAERLFRLSPIQEVKFLDPHGDLSVLMTSLVAETGEADLYRRVTSRPPLG